MMEVEEKRRKSVSGGQVLDTAESGDPSTIVVVSSAAHLFSQFANSRTAFTLAKVNDPATYDRFSSYGRSKLANLLFANELHDRLRADDKHVLVNSVNPGMVMTELLRHFPTFVQQFTNRFASVFSSTFIYDSDTAALTQIYAAVSVEVLSNRISGKYFAPIGMEAKMSAQARDKTFKQALWGFTEQVLKEKGFNEQIW